MEIFRSVDAIPFQRNTVLTVGTFDGIHTGHREIINFVVDHAGRKNSRSLLVTFYPHPQTLIRRGKAIEILTPLEEKIEVLRGSDLDAVLILEFNEEFRECSPDSFFKDLLVRRVGMEMIVVGYDHAFGRKRQGDIEFLSRIAASEDVEVRIMAPVLVNGIAVSSTKIRRLLRDKKVEEAAQFLGRPYKAQGRVSHGAGRGAALGFPTANLEIHGEHKLLPGNGVYAVRVRMDGLELAGTANLGIRPTIESGERQLEVHLLDFEGDIYEREMAVEFIRYLRDEIEFKTKSDLQIQIDKDLNRTKTLFSKHF